MCFNDSLRLALCPSLCDLLGQRRSSVVLVRGSRGVAVSNRRSTDGLIVCPKKGSYFSVPRESVLVERLIARFLDQMH